MAYFQTLKEPGKRSFADVDTTDGVDTLQFIEAAEGLVGIFGFMNKSMILSQVQDDLNGNITKVRTRYEANESTSKTLEKLVENEKAVKGRPATEGLMWLLYGLSFTAQALKNAQENKTEKFLSVSFAKSYKETLRPHHRMVTRPLFTAGMNSLSLTRDEFYDSLVVGPPPAKRTVTDEERKTLEEQLDKSLAGLSSIYTRMESFYITGRHDKGFSVTNGFKE